MIVKHLPTHSTAVTASTGCAAAVVGASTFHSACCLGLGKANAKAIAQKIITTDLSGYNRIRQLKTLIVDEAAMLTGALFDKAGEAVGIVRRSYGRNTNLHGSMVGNAHSAFPFDDLQIILCGDALQLPPVDVDSQGWIFESNAWNKLEFKIHLLRHVHRQRDEKFIQILQRMRVGESKISDLSYLVQHSCKERIEGALKLYAVNASADNENEMQLATLPGFPHVFNSLDSADNPNVSNDALQDRLKHCQCPRQLILKINARVMCLKNISDVLVNGSLGRVARIWPTYTDETNPTNPTNPTNQPIHFVNIEVEFDGQLGSDSHLYVFQTHVLGKQVEPANLFTTRGSDNKKLAQRIQIPLRLAWAISIHKSQGMSLNNVEIDFQRTFSKGQAYTALSRVKTLSNSYIRGLRLEHMRMVASKPMRFYRSLQV